ncbi:MAG: phosphomannomutase/phosphoglucomutase [Bacillota bacterium]|nr:phosphomannomutase/phosphoglucomutase [Bacillota bacterium]
MSIFKACDIRGVYPDELTVQFAADLGRAVGTVLGGGPVAVGGDVRVSTPALKQGLLTGLFETGCQIVDLGILPTPAFYFAKRQLAIPGGVMVTASHNPARYNGFKITLGDWPITEEEIVRLQTLIEQRSFAERPGGTLVTLDLLPDYRDHLKATLSGIRDEHAGTLPVPPNPIPPDQTRVVLDCGNGCYSRIAPELFAELGYDVRRLFSEEDGAFPNREPNPAIAANLAALCRKVPEEDATLGVAFDGDGDRVAFVDERGRVVPSDQMIALLARHLLQANPGGKVVFDLKCSTLVPETVREAGGIPLMEKSGHAFIKTTLLKEGAVFAGEISGHFFFARLGGDDGLFAALLVADLVRENGGSLARLVSQLPAYFTTPDIRLPYHDSDQAELLSTLASALRARDDCQLSLLDGVRAEWPDGWGLLRVSVTEPLLTLRFEARDRSILDDIKDRFLGAIPKVKALVDEVWLKYAPPPPE